MQQYILQTPRLILRPLTAADAEEVFYLVLGPAGKPFHALRPLYENRRRTQMAGNRGKKPKNNMNLALCAKKITG